MMSVKCQLVLLLGAFAIGVVEPHGRVLNPLPRNSLWRDDRFPGALPNYNDNRVWCDNMQNLPHVPPATCGVCGDGAREEQHHKLGGKYGLGIVTKNYTSGELIDFDVQIDVGHWGYYEVDLCDTDKEADECFKAHPLPFGDGRYRVEIPYSDHQYGESFVKVQLPEGLKCNRCTLRWTWRTAYTGQPTWNPKYDPNPAQTFRNCMDIGIY